MRWSWRLITIAGIGIYVHATFVLLLMWVAWAGFLMRHEWQDAISGVVLILTLFVIVVLHEFGHAMTARRYGIRTRDITLLPIGGVARLERMPENPKQELAVALAGPAVNILLAALLFVILGMARQLAVLGHFNPIEGSFLSALLAINVILALFNLLPAFPMDGGRALRALLATRIDYVRATNIAAAIGKGMAAGFVLVGLFGIPGLFAWNPLLVLVGMFVWMGATQEANMVHLKSALGKIPVSQVMITDFRTLAPEDTLSSGAEFLLAGYQQDFPVMSEGKMVGLLTRSGLVNGLIRLDGNMPVADAMEKQFATADPSEAVEAAFLRLQQANGRSMAVLRDGQLVGMVTRENVGEFMMVQAAMQGEPGARQVGAKLAESST